MYDFYHSHHETDNDRNYENESNFSVSDSKIINSLLPFYKNNTYITYKQSKYVNMTMEHTSIDTFQCKKR